MKLKHEEDFKIYESIRERLAEIEEETGRLCGTSPINLALVGHVYSANRIVRAELADRDKE